jgi:quercetin dioxygenase-like cupin family protein
MTKESMTNKPPTQPFPGLTRRVLTCTRESMLVEHWMEADSVFPWHSHPHEQTVFVLEGELVVQTEEDGTVVERHAAGGDSWVVPGNVPHRVTAVRASRVLDFFTPFREDYL